MRTARHARGGGSKALGRFVLSAKAQEGRERRIQHLERLCWKRLDDWWWISPYTGTRFTLQTALDVEELRGTFKAGWFEAI